MKLTRRQEEFIENLFDLTEELDGPIHYSTLAERLGVSPFTAYDMLRVLEEKGMVTSEYHLAEGKSGPGRAERLFCPAKTMADRRQHIAQKIGAADLSEADLKEFLMNKLRQGDLPKKDVAQELLARIPPDGSPEMRYCMEVMTVMAIRLRKQAGQQILLTHLPQILPINGVDPRANLNLLGGFAFGLLVQEETTDHEWSQMLFDHVQQYQKLVIQMTPNECTELAEALAAVFVPLGTDEQIERSN